jgi:hypothetical protein
MPSVRIVHESQDAAESQLAASLARHAPADFQVTATALGESGWTAMGSGPAPDLVLLLAERRLASVGAALRSATGRSRLVTVFRAAWPDRLPAFYEIYATSDAVLLASAEYLEGTGRLPGVYLLPRAPGGETFSVLRQVAAQEEPRAARGPGTPDLARLVTVFVTTVGAPSYVACRETLARQDCTFTLVPIEHVTPLTAALQRMLEVCTTPYYVQVDEDMLLYPHAIRTLYERIAGSASDTALAVGDLYDVHLRHRIEGVKIFRHAINRRYPWEPELTAVERLQRLAADGYRVLRTPNGSPRSPTTTLGLHGTHWTPRSIYERYRREERLRRRWPELFGVGWGAVLLQRLLEQRSPLDLFAVLGVIAGALEPEDAGGVTPDAGSAGASRGLEALRRCLFELDAEPDGDRH